jgi:hypothetical protein
VLGNFTVGDALHRQLDTVTVGRRGERIAALRAIAVGGGEPDVDVLPREVPRPAGQVEDERAGRRRLVAVLGQAGDPPG